MFVQMFCFGSGDPIKDIADPSCSVPTRCQWERGQGGCVPESLPGPSFLPYNPDIKCTYLAKYLEDRNLAYSVSKANVWCVLDSHHLLRTAIHV